MSNVYGQDAENPLSTLGEFGVRAVGKSAPSFLEDGCALDREQPEAIRDYRLTFSVRIRVVRVLIALSRTIEHDAEQIHLGEHLFRASQRIAARRTFAHH